MVRSIVEAHVVEAQVGVLEELGPGIAFELVDRRARQVRLPADITVGYRASGGAGVGDDLEDHPVKMWATGIVVGVGDEVDFVPGPFLEPAGSPGDPGPLAYGVGSTP